MNRTIRRSGVSARGAKRAGRSLHRDERGSQAIESLFVIGMMTLTFGGSVWFTRLYSTGLEVAQQARQQSWEYATRGCEGQPDDNATEGGSSAGFGAIMNVISTLFSIVRVIPFIGDQLPNGGNVPLLNDVLHRVERIRRAPVLFGGDSVNIRGGGTELTCNEHTNPGVSLPGEIDLLWGLIGF